MKAKLLLLALFAMLIGVTFAAVAQDEVPAESPEDNACYAGGSLEGKCDWPTDVEDEWAWHCGWYIARVDSGEFPASAVPEWCNYFIEEIEEVVTLICYFTVAGVDLDFHLTGPLDTLFNATGYMSFDGSCSGEVFPARGTVVVAPASEAGYLLAVEKCAGLSGEFSDAGHLQLDFSYVNTPNNWWGCLEDAGGDTLIISG